MKEEMKYFGTSLNDYGHYFWTLSDNGIKRDDLWFRDIPFNPEELPRHENGHIRKKGEFVFYCENGYSILAIEGSCKDHRQGARSVFFIKETLTKKELINQIKSIPIACNIIEAIPAEIELMV